MLPASTLTRQHLEKIRAFYDAAPVAANADGVSYRRWLADLWAVHRADRSRRRLDHVALQQWRRDLRRHRRS